MGRQGHPGIKQLQKAMTTSKAGTKGRECYQSPGGRAADQDVWELELKRRCSHWVTAVPKAEREDGIKLLKVPEKRNALESPLSLSCSLLPVTSIGQT